MLSKATLAGVLLTLLASLCVGCGGDDWCKKTDEFFQQNPYAYSSNPQLAHDYDVQCS